MAQPFERLSQHTLPPPWPPRLLLLSLYSRRVRRGHFLFEVKQCWLIPPAPLCFFKPQKHQCRFFLHRTQTAAVRWYPRRVSTPRKKSLLEYHWKNRQHCSDPPAPPPPPPPPYAPGEAEGSFTRLWFYYKTSLLLHWLHVRQQEGLVWDLLEVTGLQMMNEWQSGAHDL